MNKLFLVIVLSVLGLHAAAQKTLEEKKFFLQLETAYDFATFNEKNLSFSESNLLLNFKVVPKLIATLQMGNSRSFLHEEKIYEDLLKFGGGLGYLIPINKVNIPSYAEIAVRGGVLAPMDDNSKNEGGYVDVLLKTHEGFAFLSFGITNTWMNGKHYIGPFAAIGITL
ncbi:MAG: hypothetical protein ACK5IJ_08970 [Mangrovibacterium sp.]